MATAALPILVLFIALLLVLIGLDRTVGAWLDGPAPRREAGPARMYRPAKRGGRRW